MELEEIKLIYMNFEPIQPDFTCTQLNSGHINRTFKIQNNRENYILQEINSSIFQNVNSIIQNGLILSEHLKSENYPHEILNHLPFSNGEFIWNNSWRILNYIANSVSFEKVASSEQCYEAAKFLGEFHLYLQNLDASKIQNPLPNFLNYDSRWEEFVQRIDFANRDRYAQSLPEIEFIYQNRGILDDWINLQKELPIRIIHADPKISNFLFEAQNPEKIKSLIDWDTIMPGSILYDFGDMVRSYTNLKAEDDPNIGNNFSLQNYQALHAGFLYHLEDKLNSVERNHLNLAAKSIIFIQAIRFLTDFLANDSYYRTSSENQNLDRAKNQINLLNEMMHSKLD